MDRFQEMQIFMAVADEEGFAAAARRLNISPPSVTRAIAAMEERIGTQLLSRTTRSVHLTEAGQRYLEDCRRILGEVDEAEEAAAGSYSIPCGHLTVTAPVLFGELFIAPLLAEYLDQYPSVHLNALLVDRVVSMADEGIDVAIRIGHLHDTGQHAIKVGEVRQVICAAPVYFERHGRPRHPGELSTANIVMSSASHLLSDWQFVDDGTPLSLRFDPRLVVTANQAAINVPAWAGGLRGCCPIRWLATSLTVDWKWCCETSNRRRCPFRWCTRKATGYRRRCAPSPTSSRIDWDGTRHSSLL